MLAYDAGTARIVLAGRTQGALLVDVALCLDARAPRWAAERLAVVMVVGHLECCEVRRLSLCVRAARRRLTDCRGRLRFPRFLRAARRRSCRVQRGCCARCWWWTRRIWTSRCGTTC